MTRIAGSRLRYLLPIAMLMMVSSCATIPRQQVSTFIQPGNGVAKAHSELQPININKASAWEMEKLPGVGRVLAERIVAHREQYGPFRRAEHLMMVRGISDRKFREMRTLIVVE